MEVKVFSTAKSKKPDYSQIYEMDRSEVFTLSIMGRHFNPPVTTNHNFRQQGGSVVGGVIVVREVLALAFFAVLLT